MEPVGVSPLEIVFRRLFGDFERRRGGERFFRNGRTITESPQTVVIRSSKTSEAL